jgi:hypothetical protein
VDAPISPATKRTVVAGSDIEKVINFPPQRNSIRLQCVA